MTNPAHRTDDAILGFGHGFDCRDGAGSRVGRAEGQAVDIETCGGCDGVIACVTSGGADAAWLDAIPQTGAAGDDATLLDGAAGIDTLDAAAVSFPPTGQTVTFDLAATPLGANLLWTHDPVPTAGVAFDLSVTFILHQVEHFSVLAPHPVGFRTGCAR